MLIVDFTLDSLSSIRSRSTNRSIAKEHLSGEVCSHLKLPRGKIRKEMEKRVNMALGALKRRGRVKEYKTPHNVRRIRLVKDDHPLFTS